MGLSVSVSVRSQRLKDVMYEFLQRLYRPWSDVLEELGDDDDDFEVLDFFRGPFVDSELDSPGKCLIGFDYEPVAGPEREYHYALVRWIALQVGKRRRTFRSDNLKFAQAVPYYVYDGIEAKPILLASEWPNLSKELKIHAYNNLGMSVGDEISRELSWLCIPYEGFSRVATIYHGQSSEAITEGLIQEGLEGAEVLLSIIRTQIARLDVLWRDHLRSL